jgi:hypothetical protein
MEGLHPGLHLGLHPSLLPGLHPSSSSPIAYRTAFLQQSHPRHRSSICLPDGFLWLALGRPQRKSSCVLSVCLMSLSEPGWSSQHVPVLGTPVHTPMHLFSSAAVTSVFCGGKLDSERLGHLHKITAPRGTGRSSTLRILRATPELTGTLAG